MVLEFPKDSVTWGKLTQYQFMNGEWLLVAPVYKSEGKRDSIYLPKGKWIDYWNGETINGNIWLNNYNAPLDKLPVFVKEGAIIPMYPLMNFDGEKLADTLTLDIYPAKKSSFDLYEDDGITREHRNGAFAKTLIEVDKEKNISIVINTARGNYKGLYKQRSYILQIHGKAVPKRVLVNGKVIENLLLKNNFINKNVEGFYFDVNDRNGIVNIKTKFLNTSIKQNIELVY